MVQKIQNFLRERPPHPSSKISTHFACYTLPGARILFCYFISGAQQLMPYFLPIRGDGTLVLIFLVMEWTDLIVPCIVVLKFDPAVKSSGLKRYTMTIWCGVVYCGLVRWPNYSLFFLKRLKLLKPKMWNQLVCKLSCKIEF